MAIMPSSAFAQSLPPEVPQNSHAKSNGSGRECDYGFREAAGVCGLVPIPSNGHLVDYSSGRGWECDRGYRETAETCAAIIIPANAHSADSSYGRSGWECDRGFQDL